MATAVLSNGASQFLPDNQPDIVVKTIVSTLLKTGLEA